MKKMNIDLKKKKERQNTIIRRTVYFVTAAFFYVLMTSANFPKAVPLLLVPAAVSAAIYEAPSPLYSAVFGCVCGLLLDRAIGTLISFDGIILGSCSMMISLLFLFYLRKNLLNFVLLDLAATFLQSILHYLFFYLLWGYDSAGTVFSGKFVPEFIMTNLFGIIVYGLFFVMNRFLGNVREHYIEETSEDIKRE